MKHAPAPAPVPVLPTPVPIFVYCFQIYDSLGQDEEEDHDCLQNRGVPKIPRKIAIDHGNITEKSCGIRWSRPNPPP